MFDSGKAGVIEKEKVRTILNTLGHTYNDSELDSLLEKEDTDGKLKKIYVRFTFIYESMLYDSNILIYNIIPNNAIKYWFSIGYF